MPMFDLELPVQGQSLPRIYDNFVALRKQTAKTEAELQSLQKKMRKEPQLDKQLMMNKQVNRAQGFRKVTTTIKGVWSIIYFV